MSAPTQRGTTFGTLIRAGNTPTATSGINAYKAYIYHDRRLVDIGGKDTNWGGPFETVAGTTSQVLTGSQTASWAGQSVDADDTLVMYTWSGDANRSGYVHTG